jgi:4-hydroxy-2,2'-bipyrrole-5-methanol synthase
MIQGWHRSYAQFHGRGHKDLFDKCVQFHQYAQSVRDSGVGTVQYRLELLTPLDAHIVVRASDGRAHNMICFDSNSYLGLHLHPRIISAVHRALDEFGYGTASAQVLGGTNSNLLELEHLMAQFHGRQDALIFPSGYQANVGILTGLLRKKDRAYIDQYSHASIHDGAAFSGAKVKAYPHCDVDALEAMLAAHEGDFGKLIVSDGVFSMHGDLAPLPGLIAAGRRLGARVMIDDAHGLGVIGPTGRGLEEHYGMQGETDLYMGTFSKAPGSLGGYICADAEIIDYLRYFARGSLFTATTPAALCAGLAESVRVMQEEPEHREKLWQNCRYLWNGFDDIGLQLRPLESPIIPVAIGDENMQGPLSLKLFDAGIKCGFAQYPAVPMGECMLRFTVCSRHDREDLDRTIGVLHDLSKQLPIRRGDRS